MTTSAAPAETTPGADGIERYVVSVRDLEKHYPIKEGVLQRVAGQVRAVDGVSFDIRRGEIVGMVGESGCGKSSLGQCISGLSKPTSGGVFFDISGAELQRLDQLLAVPEGELGSEQSRELDRLVRAHRGDRIRGERWRHYRRNCQVIFQDTFSSLNPRHLVKDIVGRPLRVHREASGSALVERTVDLLESVGLGRQHLYRYPHQFSGGQRQRISIARALALDPELLVLDEPTSALDVSVQAQILNLLSELQHEHSLTYLFISHDLNVVRHMSDRIVVMYLGQVVEHGSSEHLFTDPQHPYTEALLAANPLAAEEAKVERKLLEGPVPDPARPPQGCRFHTRCPVVTPVCGWEIDDVVRSLENRPDALDGLAGVTRESAFHAHLTFDTEEQAARLTQEIGLGMPDAATEAIEVLRADGTDVEVRFREVEPVELEETRPGHTVSCVLRTTS
ncbi:MAG: ABC transporter ATP-binding protein [Actinomycetia bacterium]|nr:ABC transporter ATP-binding protein [Actinomycetes bacterium]